MRDEFHQWLNYGFDLLNVWSRHLMPHHLRASGRMHYEPSTTRERPYDSGGSVKRYSIAPHGHWMTQTFVASASPMRPSLAECCRTAQ